MPLLAALSSLLFPGAGQALTGRIRPAVVWALAGTLPMFAVIWWPLASFVPILVRIAAAIDAWRLVARERPGSRHTGAAGIMALANVFALVLIRLFVVEAFAPTSTSMAPTLTLGDHVFIDKLGPRFTGYHRGDVVVFDHILGVKYLKRIVAFGGDDVAVRADGVLVVNGRDVRLTEVGPTSYWDLIDARASTWKEQAVIEYTESIGEHRYNVFHAERRWDFPNPDAGEDPCNRTGESGSEFIPRPTYRRPPMTLTADGKACRIPPGTAFMLGDNRDNSNDSRSWGVVPLDKITGRVVGIWWSSHPRTGFSWARMGTID